MHPARIALRCALDIAVDSIADTYDDGAGNENDVVFFGLACSTRRVYERLGSTRNPFSWRVRINYENVFAVANPEDRDPNNIIVRVARFRYFIRDAEMWTGPLF